MTISLEYIGAAERYFETAATGKSQSWRRGQTQDVSDTDAALLMATGLFAYGGADAQAASNIAPGKPVTATTNLTGGIKTSIPLVVVQKFTDFSPSIIGSMAAGATYGQAGNTVTVTHAAHGLPTGKEGYRFYWPGSVAIPAGWFPGFSRIDANTFSFINQTEQSVSSGTAITGALPVSGLMSLGSITVGKGTVDEFGSLVIGVSRGGDTSASTKSVKAYLNGNVIADNGLTTTPFGRNTFTVSRVGVSGTIGMRLTDNQHFGSGNYLLTTAQADFTNSDVVVDVRMSVATVSGWVSVDNMSLSFMA